jgi:hypothetical protein
MSYSVARVTESTMGKTNAPQVRYGVRAVVEEFNGHVFALFLGDTHHTFCETNSNALACTVC